MESPLRYLFLILLFQFGKAVDSSFVYAQNIDTSCNRIIVEKCPNNVQLDKEIFVVSREHFQFQMKCLYKKMTSKEDLSDYESTFLLKTMNTYWFCVDEYANILDSLSDYSQKVKDLFYSKYYEYLKCKYSTYWGPGGGVLFEELRIVYTGSDIKCSMIYVEIPLANGEYRFLPKRKNVMEYLNG